MISAAKFDAFPHTSQSTLYSHTHPNLIIKHQVSRVKMTMIYMVYGAGKTEGEMISAEGVKRNGYIGTWPYQTPGSHAPVGPNRLAYVHPTTGSQGRGIYVTTSVEKTMEAYPYVFVLGFQVERIGVLRSFEPKTNWRSLAVNGVYWPGAAGDDAFCMRGGALRSIRSIYEADGTTLNKSAVANVRAFKSQLGACARLALCTGSIGPRGDVPSLTRIDVGPASNAARW